MTAEVVATGLGFPEGPVVLPDGRIAFCEEHHSRVSVLDGSDVSTLAFTGGAPNGATLGSDGALYVTQNGGVVGAWRADPMIDAGIQRATLGGEVSMVLTSVGGIDLVAPNDICFGPDGLLYFTDPAHPYDPDARSDGRIFSTERLVVRPGAVYNNGLAFLADGTLTWVESYTRAVRSTDALICVLPEEHIPDGYAVASDGRLFIATVTSHGITVVAPDGTVDGFIGLDERAMPTNCAFDGSALWVTDAGDETVPGDGRLWRVETDATGLPLHTGAI